MGKPLFRKNTIRWDDREIPHSIIGMVYLATSDGLPANVRNVNGERAIAALCKRLDLSADEAEHAFVHILDELSRL